MLPLGGSIVVLLFVVARGVWSLGLLAPAQAANICATPKEQGRLARLMTPVLTWEGVVRVDTQVDTPQQRWTSA
jgi:hypothetical protein